MRIGCNIDSYCIMYMAMDRCVSQHARIEETTHHCVLYMDIDRCLNKCMHKEQTCT